MTPTPRMPAPRPRLIVQSVVDRAAQAATMRADLFAQPAHIAPKFFYDVQGCALFDAICKLDEYYPTRTEAGIFAQQRDAIAAQLPRHAQWIDLGCGDCAKSRDWLGAVHARRFIGVDIAADWLRPAIDAMALTFGDVDCVGVVADFTGPLDLHAVLDEQADAAALFFYPGSSIGNFARDDALSLLRGIRAHLDERGALLIGVDLVKDAAVLEAAYDDALGVTAAFNRNVLRVANRMLDADFNARAFNHRAHYDSVHARIEMRLESCRAQDVRIGAGLRHFAAGETILTEYSHKYTPDGFAALLGEAGFGRLQHWSDAQQRFAVFVARL